MGFLKTLYGGFSRDAKMAKLKKTFYEFCPDEEMNVKFESYCGMGMMVAQCVKHDTVIKYGSSEFNRIQLISLVDESMLNEKEYHRVFALQAYRIGTDTMY